MNILPRPILICFRLPSRRVRIIPHECTAAFISHCASASPWKHQCSRLFSTLSLSSTTQPVGRLMYKPQESSLLRCTEFDSVGKITVVSGKYKKSDLCTKHGLLTRDLRKLESNAIVPHLLVREHCILVNLLHIRALIKHDTVLVFDVYGSTDSYTQSLFMYDLEGKLALGSKAMSGLPYEFRALESVLISVTTALETEMKVLDEVIGQLLTQLEEDIDRDKLRSLLIYSKKVSTFELKAKLVRNALEEVLDSDEDLADMYLSEKARGTRRNTDDHSEVELLLESYHKICDEMVHSSGNLVSSIKNTEEISNIVLDANRNSLMVFDLKISIATLGVGCGAFMASLYGMNVTNYLETQPLAFLGLGTAIGILSSTICLIGFQKLRKTQRATLWGDEYKRPSRSRYPAGKGDI